MNLRPGLLILQGNRLEALAATVFAWLRAHPLAALEEETLLVQSNGMAEWLKMELAAAQGICAATRVELPARFIWRAYRAVLGPALVPSLSPLDEAPLTWRLMALLPTLVHQPGFEPVAAFLHHGPLAGNDASRRLQLAQRLADLFDQYQVYRSDWLQDWAAGHDRLRPADAHGDGAAVPADQAWQPALWRALLAGLAGEQLQAARPQLHQRFLEQVASPAGGGGHGGPRRLPRRIVLFGTTHLPRQTLEAIAALAAHTQVLMAVPNPCRYHWADTIDGRELLRLAQRRQPLRGERDLAVVPLQDMHAHGHPLLAAWGRQSRDFVRQLDAFDDVQQMRERFAVPRVDLFDDGPGRSLLQQVQAHIRDLLPLAEHPQVPLAADDRSIVFHVAHSAQREVEILHDQLLHLLAHPPGAVALNPRDIVVMVPDIDAFAPAIRSVFGQHARGHARHIPWGITDQRERGRHPLLVALEWLLRAPQQRFGVSALRSLLDVPAVAHRFDLKPADLPQLVAWIEGAGARWGLHAEQRASLGLEACGDGNTWRFALQRMLLGYATGELPAGHAGIEPHAEVAGLTAGLAGALAELLKHLDRWWADTLQPLPPARWGERLRGLLSELFQAVDDADRAVLTALDDALGAWLQHCEAAAFDAPVELAVLREAWLDAVDEPGVARRFKAGGVTFCTLLPMRAIPFEVLCLLGMNEGDYPRRSPRSDFDLMAQPGQARPGDRLRRDDDRQLMLDALLSARRVLYLSWAGRSQRDNQPQPPSVLVGQLRDYLVAGWGEAAVHTRSTEHPLQPFSRVYFEPRPAGAEGLVTYAAEWRLAHDAVAAASSTAAATPTAAEAGPPMQISVSGLAAFLRNPVKAFFRHRLQVRFDEQDAAAEDDESFVSAGLERWALMDEAARALQRRLEVMPQAAEADLHTLVEAQVARQRRAGRLPMAGPGARTQAGLVGTLLPMLAQWRALQVQHPQPHDKQALRLQHPDDITLSLDDWLLGLRSSGEPGATPLWIELQGSKLADKKRQHLRVDKLLPAWVRCLASAACGVPAGGVLIGADVVVQVSPPAAEGARETLLALMQACRQGLCGDTPWPTAVGTGLVWLSEPEKAPAAYEGSDFGGPAEGSEACLARLYPDFATLRATGGFDAASALLYAPYRQWLGSQVHFQALPDQTDFAEADDE